MSPSATQATVLDPCNPSPCGANAQCRAINGQGVCSCLPGFLGSPPSCRPECTINAECAPDRACYKFKCTDPCPGTCGLRASCKVINHNPLCSCPSGFTGDPFVRCTRIPRKWKQILNLIFIIFIVVFSSNNVYLEGKLIFTCILLD